jgi:predicted outer membrane repeat protein
MTPRSWIRQLFARTPCTARRAPARYRPRQAGLTLEELEPRNLPSTTWYVNDASTGANTGQSWANAFTDLQTALKDAKSGDQVWVEQGRYKPTAGTDRTVSFVLDAGVAVYGGFAGTETQLSQRDPATNVTTLSGDIGRVGASYDNSYHVVRSSGLDQTAVLDGFTITAGNANGATGDHNVGGGMYNDHSSPTLTNVTFSSNSATHNGGGMYNSHSSPTLTNVTFSRNYAHDGGGGLYNAYGSSPTLTNVTFSSNSATYNGGGMHNYTSSSPTLTNVTFSGNSAGEGGGMFNNDTSSPTLTNVTFSGNSAGFAGGMFNDNSSPTLTNVTFSSNSATNECGGLYNYSSSPTLTNVTFSGNSASYGGGMYNDTNSSPTLTNVTFSSNSATQGGGGLYNYSSSPTLTNVTFSSNSASNGGGGMENDSNSSPTLTNAILWGDTGGEIGNDPTSSATVSYSDVQRGFSGTGNLNQDPRFVDAAHGDLHLQSGSPAIDSGTNSGAPLFDLDHNPRPVDGGSGHAVTDMGAYEFRPVLYVNAAAAAGGDGTSWARAYPDLQQALAAAHPTEQIWVAQGTYKPTAGTDRTVSFVLDGGVAVYGGFAGTETQLSQRDWAHHVTTLSGDIGTVGDKSDNSYHVVYSRGLDQTAVLDGFTITAGNANGASPQDVGGGMYNANSSPTLTNVTFSGNSATSSGGMFNSFSSPTLTNAILWGDTGGEIFNDFGGSATVSYSDVQRGLSGTGSTDAGHNIDSDPLFVDATHGDLHLQRGSPAIDAGTNSGAPLFDLDHNPRPVDGGSGHAVTDMGAYEFRPVLYVNAAAARGGDGTSWARAYPDLQQALAAAHPTEQIWVEQGTYKPTAGTDRTISFVLDAGVAVYGGFAGTETQLSQRDWAHHVTTLSGDIGTAGASGDNSYHVVSSRGLDQTAVLDGFTITAGNADGASFPQGDGGGMYNDTSSPTLTNLTFSGNSAHFLGGGMFNYSSSPALTNVSFSSNSATNEGGGMYNDRGGMVSFSSSPTLTNVTFSGNKATFEGGGMYNDHSSPTLTNVILWGDTGGEIVNGPNGSATVSYSDVQGGLSGTGNLNQDPRFVDAAHGDLHLQRGSPAIDKGTNTGAPPFDRDGNPRPVDGGSGHAVTDLGAYEFRPVLYVNAAAAPGGDGTSWARAYPDLQQALAAAHPTEQIWVEQGTYKPTAGTDRTVAFVLDGGVAVYGGFAGTETQLSQRDPARNVTTLSGDIGTAGDNSDNSYHVVFSRGLDQTAVLDGFTITAGNANGAGPQDSGGGMFNFYSSPTLTNVTFSSNSADYGGGMDNESSSPTLTNITFSSNSAGEGGGMDNESSSPTLTNVTFSGNSASNGGGGMDNASSSPTLTNVTFSGNSASNGGGLYNFFGSSPTLTNAILWGDTGGEIVNVGSASATVRYSDVQGGFSGTGNLNQDPLLAPLGNYGGPTQTIALLPGSPAIDAGTRTGAPATDQRGRTRLGAVDLGAFESQGFTLSATGSTAQSAAITAAFANPLVVNVTANNAVEPVAGGRLTFTAPATGASAAFTAPNPAVVAATDGTARVSAQANDTVGGPYAVTVAANGAAAAPGFAGFTLSNTQASTSVTVASSATAPTYGQAVTFSATITAPHYTGGHSVGGTADLVIDGRTVQSGVAVNNGTVTFAPVSSLSASSTPLSIKVVYNGDSNFLGNNALLAGGQTINPAPLSATAVNVRVPVGVPFSGPVATFRNADPLGNPSSYSATIAWGDGSSSAGTISDSGGGTFTVSGSHTYTSPGSDTVSVLINHNQSFTTPAPASGTATVSSDVVLHGTSGDDNLVLMRTAGGQPGDVTYTLNGAAPLALHGVTSFTFNAGAGNDTLTVSLANGGPLVSNGAVAFDGGTGVNTLNLDAAGLPVRTIPGSFNAAGQAVNFSNTAVTHVNNAAAVDAFAGPDTADRATALAGLSAPERFVQALYLDDLGRAGSKAELDGWVNGVLNQPGGSPQAVAAGIAGSLEARDHLVQSWYLAYLGRPAQGGEEQGWVRLLQAGQSAEQVLGAILASPEFFNRAQALASAGTPEGRYVRALHELLLGRPGGQAEVDGWANSLSSPSRAQQRQVLALGILSSQEFRTDQFEGYYNALLHRPADSGLAGWVASGLDAHAVCVAFESGPEFFSKG